MQRIVLTSDVSFESCRLASISARMMILAATSLSDVVSVLQAVGPWALEAKVVKGYMPVL